MAAVVIGGERTMPVGKWCLWGMCWERHVDRQEAVALVS